MEIKKTNPTFIISVLKVEYWVNLGFLFLTFLLIKFLMQINGWGFSCSNSALRAYCPKKYIVGGGVKSAFLNVRISTTYCDIFLFKLPIMECVSLGVCSKVYMENYKWKNKQIARTSWIVRKKIVKLLHMFCRCCNK